MKGLLLLLIVLGAVWLWRSRPSAADRSTRSAAPASPKPLEMVRCRQCGLHLPGADAVQGKQGHYCCADHLHQSEP